MTPRDEHPPRDGSGHTPSVGSGANSRHRRRRWWRWTLSTLILLIGILAIGRILLPGYLKSYVNGVLQRSPDYDGSVGDIEVNLWRGAYALVDVQVVKTTRAIPVPFFEARRVDLALDWPSLLHGQARGHVRMERPRLNFVAGPSKDEQQTGINQPWLGMINDLFPFRIDKAELSEGEIHFRTFHTTPPVNVYLSELEAEVTNLTNVTNSLDPLMATVHATGTAMESGRFRFDMTLNPESHLPAFNLATRLVDVDVRSLNSLTLAYGDFDFEEGLFDFACELSTQNGHLEGYAKPLFRNVTVVGLRDLRNKDPLQILWESLVGIVGTVFKNQPRNQFGTRIGIEGDLDNPRTSLLEIIGNILRNAFIRAYLPRIEGRVAPDVHAPGDEPVPIVIPGSETTK